MKESLAIGNIIKCKVTGIEKYGIFVHIDNDYNGLIHISEISEGYVRDIHQFVSLGEIIYCQVLDIDNCNKKLKLSIKNINYKLVPLISGVQETRLGFLPLKEHLDIWIEEKLRIYKDN